MNQSNFNAEAHSIIPQSCLLLHPRLITKAILTTAYVVLLIAACTVNTIVIYLVRTCKDLRQSTFNHLIINMAVADIIDVCFSTITSLSFMFVGFNWISGYGGKISCKLVCFSVCFNRSLNLRARDYVSGSIYGNCTRNDKSNILSNNEKMYSLELDSVSPSGCSLSLQDGYERE